DYVIGVAPGISAKAAGAIASVVADRALVLSFIVGAVALLMVYLMMRRQFLAPSDALLDAWHARASNGVAAAAHDGTVHKAEIARGTSRDEPLLTESDVDRELREVERKRVKWSKLFAVVTPLAFLGVVALMVLPKFLEGVSTIKGGDAASLVGGTAGVLLIFATLAGYGPRKMLDATAEHVTEGFVFAFRAMGSVLPIAGFFFLGGSETAAAILGLPADRTPSLLFELVQSAQQWIPNNQLLVGFGVMIVGMVTGIDGSGFSGLPLTGALAGALAPVSGVDVATLAAL